MCRDGIGNSDRIPPDGPQVTRSSPHPLLGTEPSLRLLCRAASPQAVSATLLSYNALVLRELGASLATEEQSKELRQLLATMDTHTTSICRGIPEEKLLTWVNRKNLSQVLIERFSSKVVFRERSCSYVMVETDHADICRSCAMLLSTSSMDLMGDLQLPCPVPDCSRTFKYQGALDKHVLRHEQEDTLDPEEPGLKEEGHIKLEDPSMEDLSSEPEERGHSEGDFLDRLLSDLDGTRALAKGRRRKKKKPATRDFHCSDCGKAFYFQKNLFSHVVEKHGKSIDELPNLDDLKEEYEDGEHVRKSGKRRLKGEKDKPVVCDECGVSFKFASGLYNHRKRMHGDIEKKQCPHCEREVKACTLDQHIREEHGTPRFACQFCGKGFYYKSFMLNHQRLHTGDYKECVCDLCGAKYKSVQVLNRHVRNAHHDLRNHKCQHCDKAFHNKQRLERHINSQHTKARIWPCPVCNSKYDRKDNLRTHIRKNHSNVVDVESVELNSIDNAEKVHARPVAAEPTIDPETGELERVGRAGERAPSVHHVAQDLLSLKYGEGEVTYRALAPGEVKAEVVHYAAYQPVKVERAEVVVEGPGLGQVARALSRDLLAPPHHAYFPPHTHGHHQ